MARIPQHELERLKREISVQRLAEARGVKLAPYGDNLIGLCPFHDDKEPSLVISPRKNLWNCLGACGQGGSVVDWVMTAEGVSFRHAVELLREDLPPVGDRPRRALKRSTVPKLPPPVEPQSADHELVEQVVGYYHETLKQSPEALGYLESRGLRSSEMIERFRLGFANRTLGYRLPQKNRKEGKAIRERLQKLGILRKSGHEHLNGSVIIPIRDAEGRIVQLYGRKITPRLRKGTPLHLYLPGPHRGLFNLAALRASKEIILCEALIDALTFWCAGYRNVTSAFGTNGFSTELLEAFVSYEVERVLIAYDRDEAGEKAADKLAEKLGSEGIEAFRIGFPRGMDANEYAQKVSPAGRSLELLIRNASWMGRGKAPATAPGRTTPDADPMDLQPSATSTPEEPTISSVITNPEPDLPLAAQEEAPPLVKNEEPPASPVPEAPSRAAEVPVERRENEVLLRLGDRRYRVRGLARNMSYDQLRVNVLVSLDGTDRYHVDTFNLYSARQRSAFLKQAASELELKEEALKRDLGKVLLKLEELQDEAIRRALEPEQTTVSISDAERAEAIELLKDPALLERIVADLEACGLVGEETNKLTGYLAAVSRKLSKPLAVMVQSSSAAGKSALMEAVLALIPEEERVSYSAMTGQSLFYMGETDLKHKVLAIAEEEGAERASYALKLLQSEGKLSIASTGKDPSTGRLVTHEYHVEGPVAIMLTTTAIDLDEELLNRCLVLSVDEDRDQTRAIHQHQREAETLEGLKRSKRQARLVKLHRNAQRLLRPLAVVNAYACELTFPDSCTRTRRDHEKYLALIRSVALLYQHQRPVRSEVVDGERVEYVEVELSDIAVANRIAAEVLGRTLDELPPQTRRFLDLVHEVVAGRCEALEMERCDFRFSRRELLDATGWSYPQIRRHLERLVEHEYVLIHRGGRGQSFEYELLWDGGGADGQPFVIGLIDVESIAATKALTPPEEDYDPSLTPHCPPDDPRVSVAANEAAKEESSDFEPIPPKTAHQGTSIPPSSYEQTPAGLRAAAQGE
jgi:DNA primase catalytic core